MADPNRALFESVVRLLTPVLDELVFVGGCTTGRLITDPAAGGIRPTRDVDAIVDVTSSFPLLQRCTVVTSRFIYAAISFHGSRRSSEGRSKTNDEPGDGGSAMVRRPLTRRGVGEGDSSARHERRQSTAFHGVSMEYGRRRGLRLVPTMRAAYRAYAAPFRCQRRTRCDES